MEVSLYFAAVEIAVMDMGAGGDPCTIRDTGIFWAVSW